MSEEGAEKKDSPKPGSLEWLKQVQKENKERREKKRAKQKGSWKDKEGYTKPRWDRKSDTAVQTPSKLPPGHSTTGSPGKRPEKDR
jgi:hypothetical protein